MTTKDLVRAEIERLKHYAKESKMEWVNEGYNQNAFAEDCRISSFDKLLTFLDTLPDETEAECEDLEEAAREIVIKMHPCMKDCTILGDRLTRGQLMALVKAGAEWGADHFRDTTKKVSEDLTAAAEEYADYNSRRWQEDGDIYYDHSKIQDAFLAGAEWQSKRDKETIETAEDHAFLAGSNWQKEQMMKDAVEGEVCGRVIDHINVRFPDGLCKYLKPENISHIPADVKKYEVGDKVRIIIVKEN